MYLPLGRSDHKGVLAKSCVPKCIVTKRVKFRYFSASSYAQCCEFLSSIDWDDFFQLFHDLDSAVDNFQSLLLFLYDNYAPEKTVRMRNSDPPWLSPALKALSDSRDRALSRGNHAKFVCLREKFLSEISKAQVKHYRRLSAGSNSDKWKVINQHRKKPIVTGNIDPQKAHSLNNHFQSFFSPPDIDRFTDHRADSSVPSDNFVTESEVFSLIKSRKSNSAGPDGLPVFFIRSLAYFLAYPLCLIFNACIRSAYFPLAWKRANILPLPKKDSSDFRPISLLPFFSKVLERLVKDKVLIPSLKKEIDARQFGYVPRFGGCTNALVAIRLSTLEFFTEKVDNSVALLTVDLSKAFDSVSHKLLLHTLLERFECSPFALRLIRSFLEHRQQRVCTASCTTPFHDITSGVPQGSILGPLLFALFMDDFPSFVDTKIVMYADDVSIIYKFDSSGPCMLQCIADSIFSWIDSKELCINVNKTKVIFFTRKKCPLPNPVIAINNVPIEEVSCLKILGVFFSSDFRWNDQFPHLYLKCCRALSYIKKIKSSCNNGSVIMQAFFGIVFCHIIYCWPIMCDMSVVHFKKLERLYKTACRWANFRNQPSLRDLLNKSCVKLIKTISINKDSHPLSQFFVHRNPLDTIRYSRTLLPVWRRSALYNNSFVKFYANSV